MELDPQDLCPPGLAVEDAPTLARDHVIEERLDRPAVLTHGEGRVVFGPGIDDFNAFDDPC